MLAKSKNMKNVAMEKDIPGTAEEIFTILEVLAQMVEDPSDPAPQHLPQDTLIHVFCALKLTVLEQRNVIGLFTADHASL